MFGEKKPLCPYCNAEWTDEMIEVEGQSIGGCDSCASFDYGIVIKCEQCKKVIYEK